MLKKLDPNIIKNDFPILSGRLCYLDNAATTQKPRAVLDAMDEYYCSANANPHRGTSSLTNKSTNAYENARKTIAKFINAKSSDEIVFTYNTTDSINQVAVGWGQSHLKSGDEIILSVAEHHSNLVPWQILAKQKGLKLKFIPVNAVGDINLDDLTLLLSDRVKLITIAHVTNVFGNIYPIKKICQIAHGRGIHVAVDGAQAVAHMPVDVQDIGCDFYSFSGHKMYGPMGIGVLYIRSNTSEQMSPARFGGSMISEVTFSNAVWNVAPYKYEAGTPNVAGAIGLASAIKFLGQYSWNDIQEYETGLIKYFSQLLASDDHVTVYLPKNSSSIASFNIRNTHPHDLAQIIDDYGVVVRAGFHCAEPLIRSLGLQGTVRASVGVYNTKSDIERLVKGVEEAVRIFLK